jgi:orotidine-5'-phosphate decarboxylase
VSFLGKIQQRWQSSGSMLCVGLDPDQNRIPEVLRRKNNAIEQFCCAIVDATAATACAFKPQIAYFASAGAEQQLENIIRYINLHHPDVPVILDAKRGDIGSTATHYAREAFERYQADAVTVNPYMGTDSITPYSEWSDKGLFLLCRTSNPGGDDLQQLPVRTQGSEQALYETVADLAAGSWQRECTNTLGLVVGATYPAELKQVRKRVGDMPLLVPGIGAQGGDIVATVAAGIDSSGYGMLINSSRAILYAGSGADFADQAKAVAEQTLDQINQARESNLSG